MPFIKIIEELLNKVSNRDYIKFDEKYVKLMMLTYFSLSTAYMVKSEYEVEGGYIDIALLPNNVHVAENYYIFEIKYISKGKFERHSTRGKKAGSN